MVEASVHPAHSSASGELGPVEYNYRMLQIELHGQSLANYLHANGEPLARELLRRGSLLLRGPAPLTAAAFHGTAATFIGEFFDSAGEHTPIREHARVFNPVRYSPQHRLLWHNENSFNTRFPQIIAFGCVRPADKGGDSLLVDARAMVKALAPSVVEEFRRKRVRYVRRMGLGVDRGWKDIFGTASRTEVEARCAAQDFSFRWLGNNVLETVSVRDATLIHPDTGIECWFNQIQHWHPRCLDPQDRKDLVTLLGEERLPRDCSFADGSRISDAVMDHILETYAAQEWRIACRAGDVLIIDNVSIAHGRSAYQGPRELLVAMGARKDQGRPE